MALRPYTKENAFRRRSTERLLTMLGVAIGTQCECDSYHGYTCGKHERVSLLKKVLHDRKPSTLTQPEHERLQ